MLGSRSPKNLSRRSSTAATLRKPPATSSRQHGFTGQSWASATSLKGLDCWSGGSLRLLVGRIGLRTVLAQTVVLS